MKCSCGYQFWCFISEKCWNDLTTDQRIEYNKTEDFQNRLTIRKNDFIFNKQLNKTEKAVNKIFDPHVGLADRQKIRRKKAEIKEVLRTKPKNVKKKDENKRIITTFSYK